MRMEIIAEGVESFEQVVHLRELGIRAAQGYVFAPPLPAPPFLQLVEAIDPLKSSGDQRCRRLPAAEQVRSPLQRGLNADGSRRRLSGAHDCHAFVPGAMT